MQIFPQPPYGYAFYPYEAVYYPYNYRYYNDYNYFANRSNMPQHPMTLQDYGKEPLVINIEQAAEQNTNYRTTLWTGQHFQVTLMSIPAGSDIGLEIHPDTDQFIRVEEGQGLVQMGDSKEDLDFQSQAYEGYAIMIPAGKWHNLTNNGAKPLKLYVIYAPPHHPFGTVHPTKAAAMAADS